MYLGIDPVIERLYKSDVTGGQRLIVWSATKEAVKGFWLTGSGLGTFINIFPLYAPPSITAVFDHAHNDYLEFVLETGLAGTLLLFYFVSVLSCKAMGNPFQGRQGILRAAAVSSGFTMAVHSIFDFNLHILSNLLFFASILGMIAGLSGTALVDDLKTCTPDAGLSQGEN